MEPSLVKNDRLSQRNELIFEFQPKNIHILCLTRIKCNYFQSIEPIKKILNFCFILSQRTLKHLFIYNLI